MENQKLENLLLLSMEAESVQRQKSPELSLGYREMDQTWEIIVKYAGAIERIEEESSLSFLTLYNQYAITRGTRAQIEALSYHPQISLIEKPKALLYSVTEGIRVSCIYQLTPPEGELTGKGVIIGILDSGIDIFHPDFINEDGSSRIIGLWDQTGQGEAPKGYQGGAYYSGEQISEAVRLGRARGKEIVPETDSSGHGTFVAGIAVGNGRASGGRKTGVAPGAKLLVVKLGNPSDGNFPRTTQLMTGADFMVRYAVEQNSPLVLNISFGNNFGAHNGNSILETYLNSLTGLGKITIVAGTGNEGLAKRHASGFLKVGQEERIQFVTGPYEQGFHLQLWKNYVDEYDILLEHPDGERIGPLNQRFGLTQFRIRETEILVFFGEPSPYSTNQEIYFSFLPTEEYVDRGTWSLYLIPRKIVTGFYALWLPDSGLTSTITQFLRPAVDTTLTIPSTAQKIISVGAYDGYTDSMAAFSGRGYTITGQIKPDLVAPGVNVESTLPGGGYGIKSGTSMAAPFVSGSAALLMEWGIVKGNDPYLYGEKLKAYLQKGAGKLPGFTKYPNPQTGYGRLCVRDSIPG
ncbi:MAG: S8 family peptidase [Lachnospiraceae bacterium]|nr:S8 family peptidase [Lachnospiraceae bacterium]